MDEVFEEVLGPLRHALTLNVAVALIHSLLALVRRQRHRDVHLVGEARQRKWVIPQHSSHRFIAAGELATNHDRVAHFVRELAADGVLENLHAQAIFQAAAPDDVGLGPEREAAVQRRILLHVH